MIAGWGGRLKPEMPYDKIYFGLFQFYGKDRPECCFIKGKYWPSVETEDLFLSHYLPSNVSAGGGLHGDNRIYDALLLLTAQKTGPGRAGGFASTGDLQALP